MAFGGGVNMAAKRLQPIEGSTAENLRSSFAEQRMGKESDSSNGVGFISNLIAEEIFVEHILYTFGYTQVKS